jgi:hypothetical protein
MIQLFISLDITTIVNLLLTNDKALFNSFLDLDALSGRSTGGIIIFFQGLEGGIFVFAFNFFFVSA